MPTREEALVSLFSYGTLRLPDVQLGVYGRFLEGQADVLRGYRTYPLDISDQGVIALSGSAVHMIARRTGNADDHVPGVVFEITPAELEASDDYEVDAYARVEATLESGATAFVYVGPDA